MPTGPAFGWTNNSAPYIDAANLELAYAGGYRTNVDTPEAHGAARNGTTDDTAAINSAIANVVALGIADGSYYGEVWFTPGIYAVKGSQIQNGSQSHGASTTQGNAQIPIPNIGTATPKFTLVFRCPEGAPIWDQSRLLETGTVFLSNISAGYSGTYGAASVFGGPTYEQVGSSYSTNLILRIVGGFNVITPANNTAYAIDLENVAMVQADDIGVNASLNPNSLPGSVPSAGCVGIRTPCFFGESQTNIRRVTAMGFTNGIIPGGNTVINDAYVVYCQYGVTPWTSQNRAIRFNNLITDSCNYHVSAVNTASTTRIDIGTWAMEGGSSPFGTTYHLDDNSGFLTGTACWFDTDGFTTGPTVHGGASYKIINPGQPPGGVTSPSFPSSGSALVNPFWRDAFVQVSGVTALTVDGKTVTLTSGAATCLVPSGKSITPTYSSGEAWTWWLI